MRILLAGRTPNQWRPFPTMNSLSGSDLSLFIWVFGQSLQAKKTNQNELMSSTDDTGGIFMSKRLYDCRFGGDTYHYDMPNLMDRRN